MQALADAADEDRATGGVDLARGIFPIVCFCAADGVAEVGREEIERTYREHVAIARQRVGAGA